MLSSKKIFDISDELLFQPYRQGIKLVRPKRHSDNKNHTLAEIFSWNFNIYFLNIEGQLQATNEIHANLFGYSSINDVRGMTVFDVTTNECANRIQQNNLEVTTSEICKIFEEDVDTTNLNTHDFTGLTIKLPWYHAENKLIGLLGFTVVFGTQSLANALTKISEIGLLNLLSKDHRKNILPGIQIDNVYLSKRQNEILQWLIRGKTIKEISEILDLSKRTVGHYFEVIKLKMNVASRSELIDKVIDYFI